MENEFLENATPEENTVAPAPEEQPVYTPVQPVQQKPKLSKKVLIPIIAAAAVVVVVIAILLFAGGGGGTYKTPLDLQMNAMNAKTYDKYIDATTKASNGLLDDAMKDYFDVLNKSEMMEYLEEYYEEQVESNEDEYGKDYKFYYEIEDKEKLDKDDLKDVEEDIKDLVAELKDAIDEANENDSDDWEDDAEDMGVSVADAKKLLKAMESMYKTLKSADVTDGYELEVTIYVKGSELDEPEEYDADTINVYKVNGKWVILDSLNVSF